jgi:hypothetical protein
VGYGRNTASGCILEGVKLERRRRKKRAKILSFPHGVRIQAGGLDLRVRMQYGLLVTRLRSTAGSAAVVSRAD